MHVNLFSSKLRILPYQLNFLILVKLLAVFKGLKYAVNTVTTVSYGLSNSRFVNIPDKSALMTSSKRAGVITVWIYQTK
jgi:hypothetical protein